MPDFHGVTSKMSKSMQGAVRPHIRALMIVTQMSCAARLTCHERQGPEGQIIRWHGKDESYIVQDFGESACSEGCHIMTFEQCQVAVYAYHYWCHTASTANDYEQLHRGDFDETPGCHVVQEDGMETIRFQFNERWGNSGESCSEGHHPICVVNGSHSESCQIAEEAVTDCPSEGDDILLMVICVCAAAACCCCCCCCCYRFRNHPRVQACCSYIYTRQLSCLYPMHLPQHLSKLSRSILRLSNASAAASIQTQQVPQPHVVGLPEAATGSMIVQCPAGVNPGEQLQVEDPQSGQMFQVSVPAGVLPGHMVRIHVPQCDSEPSVVSTISGTPVAKPAIELQESVEKVRGEQLQAPPSRSGMQTFGFRGKQSIRAESWLRQNICIEDLNVDFDIDHPYIVYIQDDQASLLYTRVQEALTLVRSIRFEHRSENPAHCMASSAASGVNTGRCGTPTPEEMDLTRGMHPFHSSEMNDDDTPICTPRTTPRQMHHDPGASTSQVYQHPNRSGTPPVEERDPTCGLHPLALYSEMPLHEEPQIAVAPTTQLHQHPNRSGTPPPEETDPTYGLHPLAKYSEMPLHEEPRIGVSVQVASSDCLQLPPPLPPPPHSFPPPENMCLRSVGSLQHMSGECKPCVFENQRQHYQKAPCSNGFSCEFCHESHDDIRKSKRQHRRQQRHQDTVASSSSETRTPDSSSV